MKITKIYCKSKEIEDLSKDKVRIELSWDEYLKLREILDVSKFNIESNSIKKFYKEMKNADTTAKIKWVK